MKYITAFGPQIVQLEHNGFSFLLKQLPINKYYYIIIHYFYLFSILQFHLLRLTRCLTILYDWDL